MPRTIFSALLGYNNGNQKGSKFQCKLLGNIVVTNEKLFMFKVTDLALCSFHIKALCLIPQAFNIFLLWCDGEFLAFPLFLA